MKRIILFLSLSFLITLGVKSVWFSTENSVQAEDAPKPPHPFEIVNQKAKNARSGDLTEAKDLIAETMLLTGFEDKLRGSAAETVKDRVGRHESRYHDGETEGVSEARIVRTINGLAAKLKLPEFAKTNTYEVRKLRLSLIPSFPQLIGQKSSKSSPVSAGSKLDSQMSPAEAVFVTEMLIQQKLSNEEYQVTNAERKRQWSETHNHRPGNNLLRQSQERSREMRKALDKGAKSLSILDTMSITTLILNTLGIDQ